MFNEKEIKMILNLIGFAFSESCCCDDANALYKKIQEDYKDNEEIQKAIKDMEYRWC
ncbi:hypothetical protein CLSAB_19260 [Clostridium saccharobutylicum]|uniref:hypothetical protein n=1 Tax=Clostridium saccharobutylicum TaxID=169679 RepID=UPI0009C87522|nr:hypothetical protein [Clostridium saccharobutylicum]OOM17206.1 hypothetical protein CLSAB_19260 [Clostridium saccharobutylicum]